MEQRLLAILIPTYNRSKYLGENLECLAGFIRDLSLNDDVYIIVSNNSSTDDTDSVINQFISANPDVQIDYFLQHENVGLEKNALFTLDKANAEYVMYLGDDDYIQLDYLSGIYNHLKQQHSTHLIIPSYYPVDLNRKRLRAGRDTNLSSKLYSAGYSNCYENSWRGHQLSGLVLKREGLYDSYFEHCVSNIYLFIFFVGYSALNGDTFHLTEYPVQVTQPGQENKDWSYGEDGLFNEIFDNYNKLPLSLIRRTKLQLRHVIVQFWRIRIYQRRGVKPLLKALWKVWLSYNSTFLFKISFPFQLLTIKIFGIQK